MWSFMLYKGLCVSCQKSNKTFLHGVAAETSKSWKHRWISSPTQTEWLCYVPEPCCCSCTNCAERRCVSSGWNSLVFCSATPVLCWYVVFILIVSNASLVKWTHNNNNKKKSTLCPPGLQKYLLVYKINSIVLWVSLCCDPLAVRFMAHIWAVPSLLCQLSPKGRDLY